MTNAWIFIGKLLFFLCLAFALSFLAAAVRHFWDWDIRGVVGGLQATALFWVFPWTRPWGGPE